MKSSLKAGGRIHLDGQVVDFADGGAEGGLGGEIEGDGDGGELALMGDGQRLADQFDMREGIERDGVRDLRTVGRVGGNGGGTAPAPCPGPGRARPE